MAENSVSNDLFEILCKHDDSNPSNLNRVFDSYGCNTLEAKVPVVSSPVVEKLQEIDPEQRLYSSLAFRAESAAKALEGHAPRTRNRELKVVKVDGETILAYGKERERSPVDISELDKDMDLYMRERARLKAMEQGMTDMSFAEPLAITAPSTATTTATRTLSTATRTLSTATRTRTTTNRITTTANRSATPEILDSSVLDKELEDYMREAERSKSQRIYMEQQASRYDMDDFDDDTPMGE